MARPYPDASLALADVDRLERPADLPGVEVVVASPRNRWFPDRVTATLGLCVKWGPSHPVRADGRRAIYPADSLCVRAPGCVWSSEPTGATGFLSVDVPAAYLPDDLRATPMSFAPRAMLPDLPELVGALLGDRLPLEKEQALAVCILHLRAAGLLRSRILSDEGARGTAQLAREFIEAHADLAPTLGDLAVATGRSRFTVVRAFRRRYGVTPHAYLVRLKIERARVLLADGATPGLVAGVMGFSDQAHFTRAFGSILGLGPGRYRARVAQPRRPGAPSRG